MTLHKAKELLIVQVSIGGGYNYNGAMLILQKQLGFRPGESLFG